MQILRYAAFTSDPSGGNPAGVVLDASGATEAEMQAVATRIGYSETAFLVPSGPGADPETLDVRYFSPLAEVPFCGHATIASGVAYAQRHGVGDVVFRTSVGDVTVRTSRTDGSITATLTSVAPRVLDLPADDLAALLAILGWSPEDLDPALPPRIGFAGAFHPILAARTRRRLAELDYDFPALQALMAARDWTTVDLIWRETETVFHARNPFPPGGVVEDPATGAAAAAFGGYLRELGLVPVPADLTVHQGEDLGRPGLLRVHVPVSGGISVSGTAVAIE